MNTAQFKKYIDGLETKRYIEYKDERNRYAEFLISGYTILFDLVDSTKLKSQYKEEAYEWISIVMNFYEIFAIIMGNPTKYLGDAILYFYPDLSDEKIAKLYKDTAYAKPFNGLNLKEKELPTKIFDKVVEAIELLEFVSKDFLKEAAYYVTATIGYGNGIYDLSLADIGDNQNRDFIGLPIDEVFRINQITGRNYISLTKGFYDKADFKSQSEKFEKITVSEGHLKGMEGETKCYIYADPYLKKDTIQNKRLLSEKLLVENEKLLGNKARIHLLKKLIGRRENG